MRTKTVKGRREVDAREGRTNLESARVADGHIASTRAE